MSWKKPKAYTQMLSTNRWAVLRAWKLRSVNGLCERCQEEGKAAGLKDGYLTPATCVHHIVPVESATTRLEMERLCFSPDNLQALCNDCHARTHKEMGSKSRKCHQQREDERMKRWIEKNMPQQ